MNAENGKISVQGSSSSNELRNFKNINNSLIQDALNVWSDLWAELDSSQHSLATDHADFAVPDKMMRPEIVDGFEPSCGWPEFLEKMWVLRNHLDFAKRLSQQ